MPEQTEPAAPVTLVLSREIRAGHEDAFEDVLHRLADQVGRQPGHLDLTVLRPPPGGRRIYTIVSHFASRADADTWLSSQARARLVAEAGLQPAGELQTQYAVMPLLTRATRRFLYLARAPQPTGGAA